MALNATIRIMPDTKVRSYDWQPTDSTTGIKRIVGVDFDGLNIYFGLDGDDQEKVDSLDALIGPLTTLRNASVLRQEDAELAKRDDRIDAGLGTGYVGEFR